MNVKEEKMKRHFATGPLFMKEKTHNAKKNKQTSEHQAKEGKEREKTQCDAICGVLLKRIGW